MLVAELRQLMDEIRREGIEEINFVDLRDMQEGNEDFLLVDVREPEELSKGTIPGSVALPRGMLELDIDRFTTDKDKQIVLYCANGGRSLLAAYMLHRMGFRNVVSLAGGYKQWSESQAKVQ
ncbi:MAG: rhodanese-like domain-containing protein [Candidatus Korobacteraceae bacterium]|jgi:rhodanese-related sulfurtransferase